VVIHVDAAVLANGAQPGQSVLEDGPHVPAGTSQRLACDASRVVMRHTRTGGRWKSAPERARSHQRCGEPCGIGIRPAASRAAMSGSPRGITYGTGPTAVRRNYRIWRSSAAGITGQCTRRATSSSAYLTERSSSDGRMAGRCPPSRRPQRYPLIRRERSGRRTLRRASTSMHGPASPSGTGSGWTCAGRLTSCIRKRGERSDHLCSQTVRAPRR